MSILYVLVPLSLALVAFAGWAFFWAVETGQFDDLESPAWEVLREEERSFHGEHGEDGARERNNEHELPDERPDHCF